MVLDTCKPDRAICQFRRAGAIGASLVLLTMLPPLVLRAAEAVQLSDGQAQTVGQRLWQNESGRSIAGLTAWNSGEDFASLGIGHFIWYPSGHRGPFEESFPRLVRFFQENSVQLPAWLSPDEACPWPNRSAFLRDLDSPKMRELRALLQRTISLQARFAANRLEHALPQMLANAEPGARSTVDTNFSALLREPAGVYALVDYVNFKGEGTSPSERYHGQGWGLLQALTTMPPGSGLAGFRSAAGTVLRRRVQNAPPDRHEERWLPGWLNRVATYR
jgi:hypothetical protein